MIDFENGKEEEDILINNNDLNDINRYRIPLCSVYLILSIICWVIFLLIGYFAVIQMIIFRNYYASFIWTIFYYGSNKEPPYCFIQIHRSIILVLFIITLIFATLQFIYFLIKSTYKKDYNIYETMMGKTTKYHFIPLFFISCIFGFGIYLNSNINNMFDDKIPMPKFNILDYVFNISIFGVILSLLILASLLFIYIKIKIKNETFLKSLLIKKGTFSCLICLSIYTIFNNISFFLFKLILTTKINVFVYMIAAIWRFLNLISFQPNLILSIVFKDITFSVMNLIICLGIILELSSANEIDYLNIIFNSIIMILSIASLIFVICKLKNKN